MRTLIVATLAILAVASQADAQNTLQRCLGLVPGQPPPRKIGPQAGEPRAQSELGGYDEAGDGVTEDWVQAARWYQKSAEQGWETKKREYEDWRSTRRDNCYEPGPAPR
jgi:TPR repeat protein